MPAAGLTCHLRLRADACCVMDSLCAQALVIAGCADDVDVDAGALGWVLTCRASKASPLVMMAHRMRAFLLARATAAFCQPERSRSAAVHCEIGSERLCAVITADLAPWISKLRR